MSDQDTPERLEVRSPGLPRTAIFSDPIPGDFSAEEVTPWTRLSVRDEESGVLSVVEDLSGDPMHAVFPLTGEHLWSPDGRFLMVVRSANVTPEGGLENQSYEVVDVGTGQWAYFHHKGVGMTTDTFLGWDTETPHSMLIRSDYGKLLRARPAAEEPEEG